VSTTLHAVTFDCADAAKLACFWAEVLERPVDDGATGEFAAIGLQDQPDRLPHWIFTKVPEGKTSKNRVHCDLIAADLQREVQRLVDAGATKRFEHEAGDIKWVTLLDPEGNEFDVVAGEASNEKRESA
jgi:hypothetical protein